MLFVQVVSEPLGGSRHEPEDRSFQGKQLCFSMGPVAEGAVQPGSEAGAAVAQHRCPWPCEVRALRGWPGSRGSMSVKTKKELGAHPGLLTCCPHAPCPHLKGYQFEGIHWVPVGPFQLQPWLSENPQGEAHSPHSGPCGRICVKDTMTSGP